MAWDRSRPCCRYAKCPNTREVEGAGLRTEADEAAGGFCVDCYANLYTTDKRRSRLRHVHGLPSRLHEWSLKFLCCVEPECPNTSGMDSTVPHEAHGFCYDCYVKFAQAPRTCDDCGRAAPAAAKRSGRTLCHACYNHHYVRPKDVCVHCGKRRPVYQRSHRGPECAKCYVRPRGVCAVCKKVTNLASSLPTGERRCTNCIPRQPRPCCRCGRVRPVAKVAADGDVCGACYQREEQPMHRCTSCHRVRRISGRGMCNACYLVMKYRERRENNRGAAVTGDQAGRRPS